MRYELDISDRALTGLDEAFIWYESKNVGLGFEFYEHVKKGIQNIFNSPKSFQIIIENVRRYVIKQFPFNIYYTVNENVKKINIIAIYHNSRNPEVWKERIN